MKGIFTPAMIIKTAQTIFTKNLIYGEISYLSSRRPIASEIKLARKIRIVSLEIGRKTKLATKTPTKIGRPPPLGIGLLWIIPGCFLLGSSMRLNFLMSLIARGVAITVMTKEIISGSKIVRSKNMSKLRCEWS